MKFHACNIPVLTDEQQDMADDHPFSREAPGPWEVWTPRRHLPLKPDQLAMDRGAYWGRGGIVLPTAFMETTSAELARMIVDHLNLWNARGNVNVKFVHSKTDPVIRISRGAGGYWSYLGRGCLGIPRNQQTMNLEGFTVRTPASEFLRVVCHEGGHALGCPHEHQRREIVALLDQRKTIAKFRREQGWPAVETRDQVLTPLEERSIIGSEKVDQTSIMAYWFDGSITKNGQPILGGNKINDADYDFMARMYPVDLVPKVDPQVEPTAPKPSPVSVRVDLPQGLAPGSYDFTITPRS